MMCSSVRITRSRATTARQWASDAGIVCAPSVILFDRGQEIIRIEAFLKAFHVQSVMDYVASDAYKKQPNLRRDLSDLSVQMPVLAAEAKGEDYPPICARPSRPWSIDLYTPNPSLMQTTPLVE